MSTPEAISQKHFMQQKTMRNVDIKVSNCPRGTIP